MLTSNPPNSLLSKPLPQLIPLNESVQGQSTPPDSLNLSALTAFVLDIIDFVSRSLVSLTPNFLSSRINRPTDPIASVTHSPDRNSPLFLRQRISIFFLTIYTCFVLKEHILLYLSAILIGFVGANKEVEENESSSSDQETEPPRDHLFRVRSNALEQWPNQMAALAVFRWLLLAKGSLLHTGVALLGMWGLGRACITIDDSKILDLQLHLRNAGTAALQLLYTIKMKVTALLTPINFASSPQDNLSIE